MVDYKELYCKMFSASTKALHIIQQAQVECEKMYLEMTENEAEFENCIEIEPKMYEFGE